MTNQEWIQSLNKKELAKFMAFGIGFYDCEICPDGQKQNISWRINEIYSGTVITCPCGRCFEHIFELSPLRYIKRCKMKTIAKWLEAEHEVKNETSCDNK